METKKFFLKYRVLFSILLLLIPVTAVFAWITRAAVHQIENQVAQANRSSLLLYHNTLQNEMMGTERFLSHVVYGNEKFDKFIALPGEDTELYYQEDIAGLLREGFGGNIDLAAILVAGKKTGFLESVFNTLIIDEGMGPEVEELARGRADDGNLPLGWYLEMRGNRNFLCRVLEKGGYSVMAIYDLDQMVRNAAIFYDQKGKMVFFKQDRILANEDWVLKRGIRLSSNVEKEYYFTGENRDYLVVQESLSLFQIALIEPFDRSKSPAGFLYFSPILYLLTVLLAVLCVIRYLQKILFIPLSGLVETMEKIGAGDLAARLPDQRIEEFSRVVTTFNQMVTELSSLRIRSYEQKLELEREQLTALRMQIRPHFYLNCLKSIYGLAQSGENEKIKQAVLYLSLHLRYVFDMQTDAITLEKELQMCENYISLQKECECGRPEIAISIDTRAMEVRIPPVTILTLVENCVKHGMDREGTLLVKIEAKMLEMDGHKLVDILVEDNGPGFDEDIMKDLNEAGCSLGGKGGIGINNVIRRFKLMYGEECAVRFYKKGGAGIEIMFVVREGEG